MSINSEKKIISESALVVKTIAAAHKNFLLYPESHSLSEESITHVASELTNFIKQYGPLILHVGKDALYVNSEKIYDTFGGEDGMVTPLYRDGVSRLEFHEGIDLVQIKVFFTILKENRTLPDEPKSDTVTDLWQAALPHVKYEAMDLFWDAEPDFLIPELNQVSDIQVSAVQESQDLSAESENFSSDEINTFSHFQPERIKPVSIAALGLEGETLTLSPHETLTIKQMVNEEESDDNSDRILDLLLYILGETKTAEDFEVLLNSLSEEFIQVFKSGELKQALRIINFIKKSTENDPEDEKLKSDQINNFFKKLSGSLFYELLTNIKPQLNNADEEYLNPFFEICMNLKPSIIIVLSELISSIESDASRSIFFKIIQIKLKEDDSIIKTMIESPNEKIVIIIISILKNSKNKNSDVSLFNLLSHPSGLVRSKALDYFLDMPIGVLPRIFFLIDDKNTEIRKKILTYIASERHISSETLMIEYMSDIEFLSADKNHVFNCYKALGRCGSSKSIPFLKKKLFSKAWMDFVGLADHVQRKGAAIALQELNITDVEQLLEKASKSKYKVIQNAYKFMKQINATEKK